MTSPVSDALAEEVIARTVKRLQALHDYAGLPAWQEIIAEELRAAMKAKEEAADQSTPGWFQDEEMRRHSADQPPADEVKRVARVICEADGYQWDFTPPWPRQRYADLATAALSAIKGQHSDPIRNGDEGMGQMTSMATDNAPGEARVRPNR